MIHPSPRATSPGLPTTRPAETSRAPERSSPAPASRGKTLAMLLVALALVGCGSTQAGRVLRAENDYSYYLARYAETCPDPAVTQACIEKAQRLKTWHGAVQEAAEALRRGGECPLQIERLEKVAKEYPR